MFREFLAYVGSLWNVSVVSGMGRVVLEQFLACVGNIERASRVYGMFREFLPCFGVS